MNIKKLLVISGFALVLAAPAMAQDTTPVTDPGHPRVNEVDQRIQNQDRTDQGVATGQIASPARAGADETRDARISNEAAKDEAANNGHLTKAEQAKLNRQLNGNSKKIYRQRHNQPAKTTTP